MLAALLAPVVLPVLIQEGGKILRRHMKERWKRESEEIQELRERVEKLEARTKE